MKLSSFDHSDPDQTEWSPQFWINIYFMYSVFFMLKIQFENGSFTLVFPSKYPKGMIIKDKCLSKKKLKKSYGRMTPHM